MSQHWDRNTADAHSALDIVLDHIQVRGEGKGKGRGRKGGRGGGGRGKERRRQRDQGRQMESGKQRILHNANKPPNVVKMLPVSILCVQNPHVYGREHQGWIDKSRKMLGNIVEGLWPIRKRARDMYDSARETGRDMYDSARETGRDLKDEVSYRARRGAEAAKDLGYGFTHKLSDMAQSVKETFSPSERDYEDRYRDRRGGGISEWVSDKLSWGPKKGEEEGGWGRRGRGQVEEEEREEREFEQATSRLKNVVHDAQREM